MRQGKHSKSQAKGKGKSRLLLVIAIVCFVIAGICGIQIGTKAWDYHQAAKGFEEVAEKTDKDVHKAYEYNHDCNIWLHVEDTRIDYPVMYTPDDPEYYLHRDFEGNASAAGTPFIGANCSIASKSLIIYGHHMRDGSMFATLEKFNDQSFAQTHTIDISTRAGASDFTVVGAFYEDLTSSGYYRYWNEVGNLTEEEADDYLNHVRSVSLYSTDTAFDYDSQQIVTLSTCSYGTSEERFAVVAVGPAIAQ